MNAEAFAAAVAELADGSLPGDLAVAVSGGPDSLALLLLAHAAFGSRVAALTVDHGLREGSAAEAATVAGVCAQLGVRHATLAWTGDKPRSNIQAAARDARYALMDEWCAARGIAWLATAHHADDQAETLLMRLARGSGAGLGGIRARRSLGGVTLLRPLLGVRRTTLRCVVDAAGLTPVDDPGNRDPRYDRTRARALLAASKWLDPARLAASAAHLAADAEALDWACGLAWDSRAVVGKDEVRLDAADLPRALRYRFAARALAHFDVAPRGSDVAGMVERLDAGIVSTLGGIRASGRDGWTFRRARPRRLT